VPRRSEMQLSDIEPAPAVVKEPEMEEMKIVQARVPASKYHRLHDIARERSKAGRKKVTIQDLVCEAIDRLER
jgi:hypothetical protein